MPVAQPRGIDAGCAAPSRRPPARRGHQRLACHGVGRALLDDQPSAGGTVRAAGDLDGGDAPHEGLSVLASGRIGRRHGQQLPGHVQASGLGRR